MKYLNYGLEDYLTDPQFISWVLYPNSVSNSFWEDWITNHPDHRTIVLQAKEIILKMQFHHLEPKETDFDDVLSGILQGKKSQYLQDNKKTFNGGFSNSFRYYSRIAAAIIFILLGSLAVIKIFQVEPEISVVNEETTYITKKNPRGQRSIIELQDGSKVYLNAESEIVYLEGFSGDVREIKIKGEAFFEVAKDTLRPFLVVAEGTFTKALGTSFNVKTSNEEEGVTISLTSGKVIVGSLDDSDNVEKQVVLDPGEKASYNASQGFKKEKFDYDEHISWKDGVLYFKNADYNEVIQKLERWYDVKFVVTGAPPTDWNYDGSFQNSSLERLLERLAYVQDFEFELKGKTIHLKFKN